MGGLGGRGRNAQSECVPLVRELAFERVNFADLDVEFALPLLAEGLDGGLAPHVELAFAGVANAGDLLLLLVEQAHARVELALRVLQLPLVVVQVEFGHLLDG